MGNNTITSVIIIKEKDRQYQVNHTEMRSSDGIRRFL